MRVHTSRFGPLEVGDDAVVDFPDGLIGLEGGRFALVGRGDEDFLWLQSLEDPALAVPVTEPGRFFPGYVLELAEADAQRVGGTADAEVYVVVRAAGALEECTANLRAPILVREGRGHQVLNQADDAPLRAPLLAPGEPPG